MKEWFSNVWENMKRDKASLGKWGFLLGAGVMTLVAGLFDQKIKDQRFEATLQEEVRKVAGRYQEGNKG